MPTTQLETDPQAIPTKTRILYAAAELFGRQGYTGTGLKQISEASQAPFGSLYHHFPGGKEELGDDVIRQAGEFFRVLVDSVFASEPDVVAAVRAVFDGAAETVRATGYQDACPIAAIALEVASTNERLRLATADVFASWIETATDRFTDAGLPPPRARELAQRRQGAAAVGREVHERRSRLEGGVGIQRRGREHALLVERTLDAWGRPYAVGTPLWVKNLVGKQAVFLLTRQD